jgi:hypothetical protein
MEGMLKTIAYPPREFGLPSWSPDAQHLYASLRMGVKQSFQILGWPMKAISQASG